MKTKRDSIEALGGNDNTKYQPLFTRCSLLKKSCHFIKQIFFQHQTSS